MAYINGQEATTLFTKKLESEATRIKNREDWRYQIMTLDMEIQVMKRHVAERTKEEERKAVAMEMLKDGEPLDKITKYSKLTEAAIRKLAQSMGVAVL